MKPADLVQLTGRAKSAAMAKGLPLQRVLEVFAPFLEPEVTRYYKQAQAEADKK